MHTFPSLSVVALVVSAALAGCGGPSENRTSIHENCPPILADSCLETAATIVLVGLNRQIPLSDSGIVVEIHATKNIEIRDSAVAGGAYAVVVSGGCAGCSLVVANSTLNARWVGLSVQHYEGRIQLRNSSVTTSGQGNATYTVIAAPGPTGGQIQTRVLSVSNPANAIELVNSTVAALELEDLALSAVMPSVGWAVDAASSQVSRLRAENLQVTGYRVGVEGHFQDTSLHRARIVCGDSAFVQSILSVPVGQSSSFDAFELKTTRCAAGAVRLMDADHVTLSGFEASGGPAALYLRNVRELSVRGFDMDGADYGIFVEGDSPLRKSMMLSDGIVGNMSYAGVQAKFWNVVVDNVRFFDNGHRWPDANATYFPALLLDSEETAYGGLIWNPNGRVEEFGQFSMTVKASSFVGNAPYGVTGGPNADCRDNWWGSATGPQVYVPSGDGLPTPPVSAGGQGDNVTWGIQFAPFLTSPP